MRDKDIKIFMDMINNELRNYSNYLLDVLNRKGVDVLKKELSYNGKIDRCFIQEGYKKH